MFVSLPLAVTLAGAVLAPPKPLPPARTIKAAEGYFDEVLAIDGAGLRLAVLRTDGATFAKVEVFDLAAGAEAARAEPLRSFDVPDDALAVEALHLLPDTSGVVLISRDGGVAGAGLHATLMDAAGRVAARVGPATAFGRPPAAGAPDSAADRLIAFERKSHAHGATTYVLTPYALATLAPAGKPRVYEADAAGLLRAPVARILGFHDGYARALVELPPAPAPRGDGGTSARKGILDTLTGKIADEDDISDTLAWVDGARLRAEHPDRARFAALNQNGSGVDIVDSMGKRQPAALAVPFALYDPKSLRDQEGPEAGAFLFSLGTDPLNPEAVRRRKPDLPMLDVYAFDAARGTATLRARIFTPRPVTWTAGHGKLALLKRRKSHTRGGDELQIFNLH